MFPPRNGDGLTVWFVESCLEEATCPLPVNFPSKIRVKVNVLVYEISVNLLPAPSVFQRTPGRPLQLQSLRPERHRYEP
jgi:hypothetical protein